MLSHPFLAHQFAAMRCVNSVRRPHFWSFFSTHRETSIVPRLGVSRTPKKERENRRVRFRCSRVNSQVSLFTHTSCFPWACGVRATFHICSVRLWTEPSIVARGSGDARRWPAAGLGCTRGRPGLVRALPRVGVRVVRAPCVRRAREVASARIPLVCVVCSDSVSCCCSCSCSCDSSGVQRVSRQQPDEEKHEHVKNWEKRNAMETSSDGKNKAKASTERAKAKESKDRKDSTDRTRTRARTRTRTRLNVGTWTLLERLLEQEEHQRWFEGKTQNPRMQMLTILETINC